MGLGQVGFKHGTTGLRLQSLAEICGLSPQLGLEAASYTSEALVEGNLNGSLLIQEN
jgi:hypothetical protein